MKRETKERKRYPIIAEYESFGGGIQSFTMFAMSCYGDLPKLDGAIFADTGWERQRTYDCVEYAKEMGKDHGIPLHVVQWGNIKDDMMNNRGEGRRPGMPFYVQNIKGKTVQLRRQCTKDYKIDPIYKKLKELTDCSLKRPVHQWIGFSLDEAIRMSPDTVQFARKRYPLIEQRMTRAACYEYLKKHNLPIPVKSSCIGCPYHKADGWQGLDEDEMAEAIEFDKEIRNRILILASSYGTSQREHKNRPNPNQIDIFSEEQMAALSEKEYTPEELSKVADNRQYLHATLEPLADEPYIKYSKLQMGIWEEWDSELEECSGGCFL